MPYFARIDGTKYIFKPMEKQDLKKFEVEGQLTNAYGNLTYKF